MDGLFPILQQGNDSGMSGDMDRRLRAGKHGVRLNGIKEKARQPPGGE
jgi:hypothetical protein